MEVCLQLAAAVVPDGAVPLLHSLALRVWPFDHVGHERGVAVELRLLEVALLELGGVELLDALNGAGLVVDSVRLDLQRVAREKGGEGVVVLRLERVPDSLLRVDGRG